MKTWMRWCAIGLFMSGSGLAVGSALFGQTLIDVLYEGSTGTFLDGIITGQHVHPVEHYYAVVAQRVLKISVALCLLAWGLLGFSCASSPGLLVLFLSADVMFIILEWIYGAAAGFPESDFWLGKDWGYAETFQYVKEAGIVVVFLRFFLRYPHTIWLSWQTLFLYLLLDDSLQIHERVGRAVARYAHVSWVFTDHVASAFFGSLILSLMGFGYYYAPNPLRRASWPLWGLFAILVFFGVFFDTAHQVIYTSAPIFLTFLRIGYVIEEAGEMVTISAIAWYVHRLTTDASLTVRHGHPIPVLKP